MKQKVIRNVVATSTVMRKGGVHRQSKKAIRMREKAKLKKEFGLQSLGSGFEDRIQAGLAQLAVQRICNPKVAGSIPALGTI